MEKGRFMNSLRPLRHCGQFINRKGRKHSTKETTTSFPPHSFFDKTTSAATDAANHVLT